MGRQKLSETKVKRIKAHLTTGILTHKELGEMYKVSRSQITKINLGMKNAEDKNGRWNDIVNE
jgi:hypothetical protein